MARGRTGEREKKKTAEDADSDGEKKENRKREGGREGGRGRVREGGRASREIKHEAELQWKMSPCTTPAVRDDFQHVSFVLFFCF